MCEICSGMTTEDLVARVHDDVLDRGFGLVGVTGTGRRAYTIGLMDEGHPELVLAGADLSSAYDVLEVLAERVLSGDRLRAGTVVDLSGELFGLSNVHRTRLSAGLCAVWDRYNDAFPAGGRLRVLHVEPPREWFCPCCQSKRPRLDRPGGLPGTPRREQRRHDKRRAA
jgi:hypothetical protein